MITQPFYSALQSEPLVHHFHSDCTIGDNIQPENLRQGTDGRAACKECVRLTGRLNRPTHYDTSADPLARVGDDPLSRHDPYDPLADIAPLPRRLGR